MPNKSDAQFKVIARLLTLIASIFFLLGSFSAFIIEVKDYHKTKSYND
ncbi:hypothetical protein [Tepidibacillus sp. LV47]